MSNIKKILPWIAGITILVSAYLVLDFSGVPIQENGERNKLGIPKVEMDPVEKKAGRAEYFFRMLRDPATNSIPENIRSKELAFAEQLQSSSRFKLAPSQYSWNSVGPNDVGGRTRALGIDQRNPNIIITGGVSGGIWKSIDGGDSWVMKSDLSQNMSVTDLTQDPTNPDTWYYSSGERIANSASDRGFTAPYYGTGIYKSTDNGETWSVIPSTENIDTGFSSEFDYINQIMVSPTTGSIFAASNAGVLIRSTDGNNFSIIEGDYNHHSWIDFDIDDNGNIIAIFSSEFLGTTNPGNSPGIFYSSDDGDSWTEVTPAGFPGNYGRSVITFAPSNPDIFYVFTEKNGDGSNQGVAFFKLDITDPMNPVPEDRSANIPDFGGNVGSMNLQGGYNMVVAVKPDDPNFVLVGGTNLFRSLNGFSTAPSGSGPAVRDSFWVGGYAKANNVSQYPAHHSDQHTVAFDPTDPNRMWSGHDGALSLTTNITATAVSWTDKDDGLITSQFYVVTIADDSTDNRIGGGAQDNGSPFFSTDGSGNQLAPSGDISSGDGSYMEITENYVYASSQSGRVLRWRTSGTSFTSFDYIHPVAPGTAGQLFIHPYAVDPSNEDIMYYPTKPADQGPNLSSPPAIWRNTNTGGINNSSSSGTGGGQGWQRFSSVIGTDYTITTLEVSRAPSDILYYAASSSSGSPKMVRVEDASTSFSQQNISIPTATAGGYIHDIALNPANGNELIAVLSNYNATGIFHSSDGGTSWTEVEGDLTGTTSDPGPSIRSAVIIPATAGAIYLVGTSTGLYSTENLQGTNTQWTKEGAATLGFAVVENLDSRISDGAIAVGSHGQGIFRGNFQGSLGSPGPPEIPQNIVVNSDTAQVNLDWDDSPDIDLAEYNIYKGSAPDNLTLFQTITDGSSDFSDTDASAQPIYYKISAVDNDGNESNRSELAAAFRGEKQLTADWQLAGSPLISNDGLGLPTSFQLVGFNGGYQVTNSFTPGQGYWIKPSGTDSIDYNQNTIGGLVSSTISLRQGWNLVGGISESIPVGNIQDPSGVLTAPVNVQEYNGSSYTDAANINPTDGYFIFATQQGDITIEVDTTAGGTAPKLVRSEYAKAKDSFDKLYFAKNGSRQAVFVTNKPLSGNSRLAYKMPPLSPHPVLDVRTSGGYRIADQGITSLDLTVSSYPVQVQLPSDAQGSYRLVGTSEGEEVYFDLQPGKTAIISKAYQQLKLEQLNGTQKVLSNSLSPNYPNPFNPSTTIKFELAQESRVSLEVYNILGKKVRTLVNQVRQRGTYTERFDASNLSSGTYFARIKAGTFTSIQKMTLIK